MTNTDEVLRGINAHNSRLDLLALRIAGKGSKSDKVATEPVDTGQTELLQPAHNHIPINNVAQFSHALGGENAPIAMSAPAHQVTQALHPSVVN
jgi:hypothetical protein